MMHPLCLQCSTELTVKHDGFSIAFSDQYHTDDKMFAVADCLKCGTTYNVTVQVNIVEMKVEEQ